MRRSQDTVFELGHGVVTLVTISAEVVSLFVGLIERSGGPQNVFSRKQ